MGKRNHQPGGDTEYTEERGLVIGEAIANSTTPLHELCNGEHPFPGSTTTLYHWSKRHPHFLDIFNRARRARAELFMHDSLHIADNVPLHNEKTASAHVQKARLQVDVRKGYAQSLSPDFAVRTQHTVSGPEDGPIETVDLTGFNSDELRLLRKLGRKARAAGKDAK